MRVRTDPADWMSSGHQTPLGGPGALGPKREELSETDARSKGPITAIPAAKPA
jgi:hypothetical protein